MGNLPVRPMLSFHPEHLCPVPTSLFFYVDRLEISEAFYADLFGKAPVEATPTFAMFALDSGLMLGSWSKHTVVPAATVAGGGGELAMSVASEERVDSLHADWRSRGLVIARAPISMDFGYTFVALDPDEHRLRVYMPRPY